ncbi:hypothetical protein BPS10C_195 [Bacillus phage BPS10C]|uniref:Uncharacterized protein n=1 Tax=Bacillus phage BPS10C TaxID=1277886 RepID=W5QUW5_9CAUD|nr:hypothetical protein BPS10C_195 [Bacillus phage BPS10C]AGI12192.1 hypothetical protein BPS10C_195 [Bacillus phage BPS10C]
MAEEYIDTWFRGLDVLPFLTKGWFRKDGTQFAYTINGGALVQWDMLEKEQKVDNSLPIAVLAQGNFIYQDYRESVNFKLFEGLRDKWLMEETDIKGFMTAGRSLVTIEHSIQDQLDLTILDGGAIKPVPLDDMFYALHELDLEDIEQIMDEAKFYKEVK